MDSGVEMSVNERQYRRESAAGGFKSAGVQQVGGYAMDMTDKDTGNKTPLLREEIGQVLRMVRRSQGRTLREVSTSAQVSLGYLSEVERGQKEASSELLAAICKALEVPMAMVLREVSLRVAVAEGLSVRRQVPEVPVHSVV